MSVCTGEIPTSTDYRLLTSGGHPGRALIAEHIAKRNHFGWKDHIVFASDEPALGIHKQRYYYQIYEHPLVEQQYYYSQCVCNEYNSLTKRHCIWLDATHEMTEAMQEYWDVRAYKPEFFQIGTWQAYQEIQHYRRKLAQEKGEIYRGAMLSTPDYILDGLKSKVRKRYQLARRNIFMKRIYLFENQPRLHLIKSFVKWEKAKLDLDKDKPPRMIQHRSYEFTFMHKRVIQCFVDMDKYLTTPFRFQPHNTIRTSGKDQVQVANLFNEEWNLFVDPVAILLDCSKFDAHVDYWQLEVEVGIMESAYKYDLTTLLKRLYFNRGITQHGIKYKMDGTRDSGSAATSKGNSDINENNLRTMVELSIIHSGQSLDQHPYFVHVNGDDSVIICSATTEKIIDYGLMRLMNHEIKVEVVSDFGRISYCQCQPVNINGVWKMVREPIRVLSRSAYCDKRYPWKSYFAALGLCELAVHNGVPILQTLALRHLSESGYAKPVNIKYDTAFGGTDPCVQPISLQTRFSFYQAFGITIEEQLAIERSIAPGKDMINSQLNHYLLKHPKFH